MKHIKLFASILALLVVAGQLTACLNDDNYRAGFTFSKPTAARTYIYANTTTDSVIVLCLGSWHISADTPEASWCTLDEMKGFGNAIYSFCVHFGQNTTGYSRLSQFTITDTEHPDDAHATWQYLQHATRGDGSFGTAALVKRITSSDDWEVNIGYDTKSRPVTLSVKDPEGNTNQYSMDYNEVAESLSVRTPNGSTTGAMDKGYQAERLIGSGDTIGYAAQYYSNGVQMSPTQAFNYVASNTKRKLAYAYLLGGKSLDADSLHTADSLVFYNQWKLVNTPNTVERYKLEYSQTDNRYQTVDVNQLLLGMDNCEPLQLVSMFRFCRSTSVVSCATTDNGTINVSTELNADRSVRRMVVKDSRRDHEVIYNFEY